MASNLRVDTILPSTGTNVAIGTANGSVTFLGDTDITTSGSVSIGGTLTYEDVTNVDSVGVITARSGIKVSAATSSLLIGSAHASGQRNSVEIHSSPNDGLTISRDGGGSDTDLVLLKNTSNSGTIEVRNSSNAQKIFLDSSGSSHLSGGNLGINNSIPQKRIHISTTGNQKIVIDPNYANNSGGSSNSEANANNIVESLLIRTSYGDNASSSANAGHKWGIKFQGYNGNDFAQSASKCAGVFAVSEDTGAGYNRNVGLAFHTSQFDTAHREVMRINTNGIVTKPYTPMFIAGRTGGNQTFTIGTFPFNVARVNVGNHYNTSTYKFTAPVAGVYYFFAQVYYNNGSGSYRVGFRKEPVGGGALMLNTAQHAMVGNDNAQSISIIESLAVGDTVRLFSDQNGSIQCYYNINDNTYGAHTYFMGYLIG